MRIGLSGGRMAGESRCKVASMPRLGAVFIAICMVLIAASFGATLYLGLKLDASTAAVAGLAALTALAIYHGVSTRARDHKELGAQVADLSHGTANLARQVAEVSRRLQVMEGRVNSAVHSARAEVDPLVAEIGELGSLVRQIADTVAAHETALQRQGTVPATPLVVKADSVSEAPLALTEKDAVTGAQRFRGLSREGIADLIAKAIEANRIDLYLQPIVTLPQRKVRYYEAMSRLRTEEGDIVPAGDFLDYAEGAGLMPRLDNLLLFRCVQVTRRLQLKNRDVGLICNVSASTLTDPVHFKHMLDFMEANRALADALFFEFAQGAYRACGPIEQESLAALAERGFRFSMDHITDLRMEPKNLAGHGFRFVKAPARLLLNKAANAHSDIHPEDLADLLARSGIDLIVEHIESESMVVDLLDYGVRFGQGFLFSPPRPVRAEALQVGVGEVGVQPAAADPSGMLAAGLAAR
jgi:cyclic-di-GMP phosphodiesterase TipF (flagellum assembly factor)